jgi:hypothetical protein
MLKVFDILADALEETPPPCFTLEEAVAIFLVLVAIFTSRATILTAISLVGPSVAAALIPGQLKPVRSHTTFRILNSDYRWTSTAGRTHQFLPPASF